MQHRWMQDIGQRTDFLQALLGKRLALRQQMLEFGRCPGRLQAFQVKGDCDKVGRRPIVKLSCDALPFPVLQVKQPGRKMLQLVFGEFPVGNVRVRSNHSDRDPLIVADRDTACQEPTDATVLLN